ncbi:hypothetical protein BGZ79_004053 [Entomortierella chlamydospora]|nr:hypothetical protein BGZ79_004053 [Entomortierella chlamydospora]
MDSSLNNNVTSMELLPPECLEMIIALLRYDLASLYRLLFVSRQFFQLTVPVLYKSPFRLAAGIPDPPPVSFYSSPFTTALPYRSATNSTDGWSRFLERTKLLSRLLIQNLQLDHLGQVPKLVVHEAVIWDDFGCSENLEPLIPPTDHLFKSTYSPTIEIPSDWSRSVEQSFAANTGTGFEEQEGWGVNQQDHSDGQYPDLISFDDEWGDSHQSTTKQDASVLENAHSSNEKSRSDSSRKTSGTGLLVDYFYFYTHHDHRSIASVIREIYPGAGRREYDRYLASIERAILMHNTRQIEVIHVHSPSVVVPHLHENLEKLERLSSIELFDSVWKGPELEMVHQFLMDHTAMFSGSRRLSGKEDAYTFDRYLEKMNDLDLGHGARRRHSPIRNIKYTTNRSFWDNTILTGKPFDPIQLIKALGPGLESIDSTYWPRTELADLETLDVRSLRSLKIGSQVTQYSDVAFSRPQFLSRCRQLQNLETFSNSKGMFKWAVEEWNVSKRARKDATLTSNDSHDPWTMGGTRAAAVKPLVQLRRIRIGGATDQIIYDILRDAFYGFRKTLQSIEARSDTESAEGEAEWMDHAQHLLSGSQATASTRADARDRVKECDSSKITAEQEEGYYNSLSSIASRLLLIRWEIPHLSVLSLSGSIASAFDIGSLQFMPSLHTACFKIVAPPSAWIARGQSFNMAGSLSKDSRSQIKRNMTHLPVVAPRTLRCVMIRGPWPEVTDESLQAMIETIVVPRSSDDGRKTHLHSSDDEGSDEDSYSDSDPDDNDDGSWGNQLLELSILDNDCVTVQGMIQLARQMDKLQIMGTTLNTFSRSSNADSRLHSAYSEDSYPAKEPYSTSDMTLNARDLILKAQIEMPWVDLGPDANHLGKRNKRGGYQSSYR